MTGVESGVGEPDSSFVGALSRAYRLAIRAGVAVTGTDLLLYALRFYAPVMPGKGGLAPPWGRVWRRLRHAPSGLDDRAPAQRTRLTTPFDAEVSHVTERALRLAAYRGCGRARLPPGKHRRRLPVFSPAVRHVVFEAIHEAARLGVSHAGPRHLLVAVLSLPENRAVHIAAGWPGIDLAAARGAIRADPRYRQQPQPFPAWVSVLRFWRILPAPAPAWLQPPWRAPIWRLDRGLVRRPYRRHGARYGHMIPLYLHTTTIPEHAVRLGRSIISSSEVLLGILDLHEQLDTAALALPAAIARYNQAGQLLRAHGVTLHAATRAAATLPMLGDDAEDDLHDLDTRGWRMLPPKPGTPSYGRTALTALHTASATAHNAGHPFTGTTHLLLTTLTDLHGPAARLLRHPSTQPETIHRDTRHHLDHLDPPAPSTTPPRPPQPHPNPPDPPTDLTR